MNKALIVIIAIIIAGGAYVLLRGRPSHSPSPQTSQPSSHAQSTPNSELLRGGSSYADPTGLYVFLYPNDYSFDTQNEGKIARVYKTGPTQRGQTEIYDGVVMTFESIALSEKPLSQWVDDYIESTSVDGTIEVVENKAPTNIQNYHGFTWRMRGLGEHQYYAVQKDSNSDFAVMIVTNINDPENVGFESEVDAIFSTLQILK